MGPGLKGADDDDDLITSTDGIEVKQTANQADVIDFDTVFIQCSLF